MIELEKSLNFFGWLREQFLNNSIKEPDAFEVEIAEFLNFLSDEVNNISKGDSFQNQINEFVQQPLDIQIQGLPAFYLTFEQYLTKIDQYQGYTETSLRKKVKSQFSSITELDNCAVIFSDQQWQEVLLARLFLLEIIEGSYKILGRGGQDYLPNIHEWLLKVPHNAELPLSFSTLSKVPSIPLDWFDCLVKISENVYSDIEKRFGEKFAVNMYDQVYKRTKRDYGGLRNFPIIIHLLPDMLLDAEKINLLSKQHVMRFLVDKVDSLQDRNDEIAIKNLQLNQEKKNLLEANEKVIQQMEEIQAHREELAKQKALLTKEHAKLEQAQAIIRDQNSELRGTNLRLEEQVALRTKELKEINSDLISANEELDTFVYRSSHDLLGPISSILGLCNLANMEQDKEQVIASYKKVETPANNMFSMLKRLIDIQEMKRRETKLQSLTLADVVQTAFDKAERSDLVELRLAVDCDIIIKSDPVLLNELLSNMLENAIRYRDYTKDKCWIEIRAGSTKLDQLEVVIKDNGIGVPEELKERIFDIFFRATDKSDGPGLGLYISQVIAKQLGGNIAFHSDRKHITTFKISLPL